MYAYVDADDRHHATSLELLVTHPGPLIVPTLAITEVTCLIGTRLGADAEVRFLGDLASGDLIAEPVAAGDWLRIAELVHTHRHLPLGSVDASTIALAERLNVRKSRRSTEGTSAPCNRNTANGWTCCPDRPETPTQRSQPSQRKRKPQRN